MPADLRPEDDSMVKLCQQVNARGLTRGEAGLLLKQALLKSQLRIGRLASLLRHIHVGFGTVSEAPSDLLPMPVCPADLDETRILQAFAAGALPADVRRDFPSAVPPAARSAWIFLLILLVNFLHLGWSEVNTLEQRVPADYTDAQLSVLEHFGRQVDYFLKDDKPLPGVDWDLLMATKAVDYNPDLVLKGRPVSWAQIEPGLPPEGVAGSVRAVSLAAPPMARLLMDPATCVKPREEWPLRLQRTRVFVQPGEWAKILRGLYGRGMIKFLQASELITHNGRPLLNGLFGVPKGNIFEDGFDLDSCILRLICNCIPTNELQDVVEGEIRGLPQFSQWALLEMLEREFFLVSGDDQTAAFFLYLLEKAWWPWFVLGREAPEELLTELGLPVNAPWPALCVIAMGWCSATGIVQHLHMQLVRSCRERLKTGEGLAELSKAAVMSVTRYMRSLGFLEVYLDDTLYAELCSDERFVKELHTMPPMQEVLREVYSEWGIATSSKKAFHRLPEALARGGKLDGVAGRGDPSPDKLDKVICMCWDLLGTTWARWQQLAALGGQACFLFQFRRAGFTVLFQYWEVMHSTLGGRERWLLLAEELLGLVLVLPLIYFDFRASVSPVVSCSDASEQGGGVCVARALSAVRREAALRRLRPLANLFRGRVGLWESFAGIGGARRACELLGVHPAFYVAVEQNQAACRVLAAQWPDVVIMPDVTGVTQRDADRVASGAPTVALVLHAAGSPCPGLCAWNPFRHVGRAQSEELYLEVRRTSKLLEIAFPGAAVEELEVNVSSMMNETRDAMSTHAGYEPIEIQVSDLLEQRRRRYYWCSWKVRARAGVELVERPGCTRVCLQPASRAPTASWIRPGWRTSKGFEAFPTLTRPCPVRTPRWKTPGVDRASSFALAQWRADQHRRPPIHYERRVQLVCEKTWPAALQRHPREREAARLRGGPHAACVHG